MTNIVWIDRRGAAEFANGSRLSPYNVLRVPHVADANDDALVLSEDFIAKWKYDFCYQLTGERAEFMRRTGYLPKAAKGGKP